MPADTTTAAVVGGATALLTLIVSKWWDSTAQERRTKADERREDDRTKARELADCEQSKEAFRDRNTELFTENAVLRATLTAHGIPLPAGER